MGKQQRWIQRQGQTGSFTHSSLWFVSLFSCFVSFCSTLYHFFLSLLPPCHFPFLCSSPLCRFIGSSLRDWAVFHTINCKVHSLPSAWHPGTLAWRWHATRPALSKLYCGQLACKLIVVSLVL